MKIQAKHANTEYENTTRIRSRRRTKLALFMLTLTVLCSGCAVFFSYAAPSPTADAEASEKTKGSPTGAFEVTDYEFNAVVNKDHSYDVDEKLVVNIPQKLDRLELAVPSGNFRISDITVDKREYSEVKADEVTTIVILDKDKLSQGTHEYKINYKIREFTDRDKKRDMFYFDVLLPSWKQPIGKVDINVDFPMDFPWNDIQCYAGQFGVQDANNRVTFKTDKDERSVSVKGEKIPENFGITLKAELPDGYWKGAIDEDWVIFTIIGVMTGVVLICFVMWLIGGRDPKAAGEKQTEPIEGVEPHDLGYIFNSEVNIRDIILIIIKFGMKGYLSISEYEPKRYKIYRRKSPTGEEKLYRTAYNILFEDVYKDRAVDMENLGDRLIRILDTIKDDIAAGHPSADSLSFTTLSRVFRTIGCVLLALGLGVCTALTYSYQYLSISFFASVVVALVTFLGAHGMCKVIDGREESPSESIRLRELLVGGVLLGVLMYVAVAIFRSSGQLLLAIAVTVFALLCLLLIGVMRARGKENAELVMKIRQLRNFIYHPTPREVAKHYLEDPNYYYEMLEYALAFAAEESWAISCVTLNVPKPEWFSDDVEGHAYSKIRGEMNTIEYARSIKSFMRTIETAFADLQKRNRRR